MSRTNAYLDAIRLPCGTQASYKRGCRCDECKTANAAWTKAYRERNAEKVRERKRAYYEANREAEIERARKWHADHPGRTVERVKRWRKANPQKNQNQRRTYSASRRAEGTVDRNIDYEALWTGKCGICGHPMDRDLPRGSRLSPTIDHIRPLSKGGPHTADNLQWAHNACNAGKGDR